MILNRWYARHIGRYLLKRLEEEGRLATPAEQEVLSRFVGWGGIPQAFDENSREWENEYAEVKAIEIAPVL